MEKLLLDRYIQTKSNMQKQITIKMTLKQYLRKNKLKLRKTNK